jgi:hypothetical protein
MIVPADAPTPRVNSLAVARHIIEQESAGYLSAEAWRDPYFRAGLLRQVLIHMQAGYADELAAEEISGGFEPGEPWPDRDPLGVIRWARSWARLAARGRFWPLWATAPPAPTTSKTPGLAGVSERYRIPDSNRCYRRERAAS